MAGVSSISKHPARDKIIQDIAEGVSNAEVARRYGLSESAVSRAKIAHHNALASELDDSRAPTPTDLLTRLADLADSTRSARITADAGGSPQTRARAQANELAALDKLLDRVGVTDLTAIKIASSTGALVKAIRDFTLHNPDSAEAVLGALGEHEELIELRDALASSLRKKTA